MTTTTSDRGAHHVDMRDRLHIPRSRGATSGLLLLLLGIWGGLVAFVGPYFGYAFTPDTAWHFTWGRLWLEILPGAAAFLGGLMLLGSTNRVTGIIGGWLGVLAGGWFVIGQPVSRLWTGGTYAAGVPASTSNLGYVVAWIGFFTGLGVVILFFAATALGRMSVVSARDVRRRRLAEDRLAAERAEEERMAEERAAADQGTERGTTGRGIMEP